MSRPLLLVLALLISPLAHAEEREKTPEHFELKREITIEAQGGVGGWTGGLARATRLGPSWQFRVGWEIFSWLGVDANYTGLYTDAEPSVAGSVHLINNGVFGDVRINAPFGRVVPYVFGGVGWSHTKVWGSERTPLRSGAGTMVPVGAGFNVFLTKVVGIGAEATYQANVGGGTLSIDPQMGDGNNWNAMFSINVELGGETGGAKKRKPHALTR